MKGQAWAEFLLAAAVLVFAFAYLFVEPFAEALKFSASAVGFVTAQKVVAIDELNARKDLYVERFHTSADGKKITVEGEYNGDRLGRALEDVLKPLGVIEVVT